MDFMHQGRRHLVAWQHYNDAAQVPQKNGSNRESVATIILRLHSLPEDEQKRLGVPMKVVRTINGQRVTFDGLTICRIRTLRPDADSLPASERWEDVAVGYSFKRSDEPFFDKKAARRHSLARAFKNGQFGYDTRTKAWIRFHAIWPPVRPDAAVWEKRYIRLQQELALMEQRISELMRQAGVPSEQQDAVG